MKAHHDGVDIPFHSWKDIE